MKARPGAAPRDGQPRVVAGPDAAAGTSPAPGRETGQEGSPEAGHEPGQEGSPEAGHEPGQEGSPEAGSEPGPAAREPGREGCRRGNRDGRGPGRSLVAVTAAVILLLISVMAGIMVGAAAISLPDIGRALAAPLPWHPHVSAPAVDVAILWQVRLPRVVLGALVGAMLAGSGAAYQGVFRNPLADPYLLGVAAGAGLGATAVIVSGAPASLLMPAAFTGAAAAVAATYLLGASAGRSGDPARAGGGASILLAGVAVAALLTAVQTYLQQQHSQALQQVYAWILGGFSVASWSDVTLILPYLVVATVVLLAHRRLLDLLRVGETEANALGVDVARLRLTVVAAATLGTAAAVAVAGLIGFVGIIVPHTVRLTAGASYRVVLPVSMVGGAAFLVLADIAARTLQSPAEVPIGVITAAAGAPFFLVVLRSRRARRDLA